MQTSTRLFDERLQVLQLDFVGGVLRHGVCQVLLVLRQMLRVPIRLDFVL